MQLSTNTRAALVVGVGLLFRPALASADDVDAPTVTLHVKSPGSVVAIERADTGELVCTSPCDRPVPATVLYRIGGARPSSPFALDAHGGTAKLSVEAATNRGFWSGAVVLGAGSALVASGLLAMALGYANRDSVAGSDGSVTDTTYSDTMILGAALAVVGTAAGIWGASTLAANWRTRVSGNVVKEPPARGNVQPLHLAGPTFYVPILRGVF